VFITGLPTNPLARSSELPSGGVRSYVVTSLAIARNGLSSPVEIDELELLDFVIDRTLRFTPAMLSLSRVAVMRYPEHEASDVIMFGADT